VPLLSRRAAAGRIEQTQPPSTLGSVRRCCQHLGCHRVNPQRVLVAHDGGRIVESFQAAEIETVDTQRPNAGVVSRSKRGSCPTTNCGVREHKRSIEFNRIAHPLEPSVIGKCRQLALHSGGLLVCARVQKPLCDAESGRPGDLLRESVQNVP
jgi:hypothetical protein